MMIATLHDALSIFGFGAAILAGAVLLDVAAVWMLRAATARQRIAPGGRYALATLLVIGSLPVWMYGLFFALIGWATVGCAPDAYECPF